MLRSRRRGESSGFIADSKRGGTPETVVMKQCLVEESSLERELARSLKHFNLRHGGNNGYLRGGGVEFFIVEQVT